MEEWAKALEDSIVERVKEEVKKEFDSRLNKELPRAPRRLSGRKALAGYLGCSVGTIARMLDDGQLSGCYVQISRRLTFDLDKVDAKMQREGGIG